VTVADAKDFKRRLTDEGYASTTVCQHCKKLRQFFSAAVDAELIVANPFLKVRLSSKVDEDRQEFIPREAIDRVLTKCPDAEFRLLVCLSRYGGLRCPSESDVLCWSDIDFEAGEFVVRSQKTGPRVVPLFPELVEPLRDAFEAAAEGSRHVIVRHRGAVRRQMGRVVERAGLEPWPKIFQNLRSSRETELIEQFPIHVVCKWIGNSPTIAHRHYLQVTPDHMELARSKIPMNPASLDLV
jgi:integrase